ncbi:head-tail adaptor [Comamonas odontotermitis]|uniref:Head-tail adaptor n=1 Tax=Comamonas odontotermitis TaxID=379895 RepID=A0ABR6RFR5_9BURK|nr:head-tail adaptor protein [Comamonas odontotermitis]MBB6578005.1 head-tail adaptor [Comamonas odontotermitis]
MRLLAGDLDKEFRLLAFEVIGHDPDYNTEIKDWREVATGWAQVQHTLPSKSEVVQQGVEIRERPARVRMRYLAGIRPDMRLVIVGVDGEPDRVCEIVAGPAELGRRDGIELLVKNYGRADDGSSGG